MVFDPPENPYAPPGEFPYGPPPLAQPTPIGAHVWIAAGVAGLAVVTLLVVVLAAAVTTPPRRPFQPTYTLPANALVVPNDELGEGFTLVLPASWDARMPGPESAPATRVTLVSEPANAVVGSMPRVPRVPLEQALDATRRLLVPGVKGLRWEGEPYAREVGGEPALARRIAPAKADGREYWIVVFYRYGTRFHVAYVAPERDDSSPLPRDLRLILDGWRW